MVPNYKTADRRPRLLPPRAHGTLRDLRLRPTGGFGGTRRQARRFRELKKKTPVPRDGALVLLVEDHQDVRDMYADYLKFSGFSVIAASNGAEGVDAARSEHPDLILMDATMPGIDGWEATRLLKADAATR